MTNKLVKATNTGENLSGWKIGLFTDSACTKAVPDLPLPPGRMEPSPYTETVNLMSGSVEKIKETPRCGKRIAPW